jgi:hypothetical protein
VSHEYKNRGRDTPLVTSLISPTKTITTLITMNNTRT